MRYSIEPKNKIYIKGYGFLSFAKNMGTQLSNNYDPKLLDNAKKTNNSCNKSYFKKGNPKNSKSNW